MPPEQAIALCREERAKRPKKSGRSKVLAKLKRVLRFKHTFPNRTPLVQVRVDTGEFVATSFVTMKNRPLDFYLDPSNYFGHDPEARYSRDNVRIR